jgi:hypothetical protein
MSPTALGQLTLTAPGGTTAFITNNRTGEVIRCDIDAEGDLGSEQLSGGKCVTLNDGSSGQASSASPPAANADSAPAAPPSSTQ